MNRRINHNFYKTLLLDSVEQLVFKQRQLLFAELVDAGNDPVIWKRRFRMLAQLSDWHSDIVKKIYAFETDNINDYRQLDSIYQELHLVVSRNA